MCFSTVYGFDACIENTFFRLLEIVFSYGKKKRVPIRKSYWNHLKIVLVRIGKKIYTYVIPGARMK